MGAQYWKANTLYLDFWRPTTYTNGTPVSHIPVLDVTKKYNFVVTYGVFTDKTKSFLT